jgi:signal transduction histidine kinase
MGVMLLVLMMPAAIFLTLRYFNLVPAGEVPELLRELPPEVLAQLQEIMFRAIWEQVAQFLVVTAVIGTIAGIILSRSLTRPLNKLADAANAIGARDLSQRVEVKGSDEIVAVATAFNEMAEQLENAETLRSNLLADVAHELRTPVTVIQGNLQAILDDVYPLDKEEVARLYDQTRHLTRLINDLRELAQAEAHRLPLDLAMVDVAEWVKQTAVPFKPLAEAENVTLRVELLGKLPTIQADKARLTQSLQNLLQNALRHMLPGGTITVQAEQAADEVHISVLDTGMGIAPEHLPHVFDRFYRTDQTRSRDTGGTGLGLAIVKAIVEAHNGRVTVHSDGVNKGSQFMMILPLV